MKRCLVAALSSVALPPVTFPKQLKVIREVTDDESYKNASLARL